MPGVEPRLPGQPVAHLLQAHQIITVPANQDVVDLRQAAGYVQKDDPNGAEADPPDRARVIRQSVSRWGLCHPVSVKGIES